MCRIIYIYIYIFIYYIYCIYLMNEGITHGSAGSRLVGHRFLAYSKNAAFSSPGRPENRSLEKAYEEFHLLG